MLSKITVDVTKNPFSDKIILPQAILNRLISDGFEFTTSRSIFLQLRAYEETENGTKECANAVVGVREFALDDPDSVILPWSVAFRMNILDKVHAGTILIDASPDTSIPDGKHISLEPLGKIRWQNIHDCPNEYMNNSNVDEPFPIRVVHDEFFIKNFLEARLNNTVTSISEDEYIILPTQPNGETSEELYKFKVEKVTPGKTVSLINTDVELEVLHTLKKLPTSIPQQSDTDKAADIDTQCELVEIQENEVITVTPTGRPTIYTHEGGPNLKLNILENDLDESGQVFLCRDEAVSSDHYLLSTLDSPSLVLQEGKNVGAATALPSDKLFYKVCFEDTAPNTKVKFVIQQNSKDTSEDITSGKQKCPHCGTVVSKEAFFLHELRCSRMLKVCHTCSKKYFNSGGIPDDHWHCNEGHSMSFGDTVLSYERHMNYFHMQKSCPECGVQFPNNNLMAKHRHDDCRFGLHCCRYCHLSVPRGDPTVESRHFGISSHELSCGLKTTECYKCSRIVRRIDLNSHLEFHRMEKEANAKSLHINLCRNTNCCRTLGEVGRSTGLCDSCYGPFYSPEDDLYGKKFLKKLRRKYVIQLSRGCGSTFCKNPKCKSSGLSNPSNMQDIMTFVDQNVESFPPQVYWICVDEATTKKKMVADFYIEVNGGKYSKEWVYLGVTKISNASPESLENWLEENAVAKLDS